MPMLAPQRFLAVRVEDVLGRFLHKLAPGLGGEGHARHAGAGGLHGHTDDAGQQALTLLRPAD
jgi:hypothetical protein